MRGIPGNIYSVITDLEMAIRVRGQSGMIMFMLSFGEFGLHPPESLIVLDVIFPAFLAVADLQAFESEQFQRH
jgi:hypothetical protein